MFCGKWCFHHLWYLSYITIKQNKKRRKSYIVWIYKGLIFWKLKECQPYSLLCQAYHTADCLWSSLDCRKFRLMWSVLNLTLKSVGFHVGKTSSYILLSDLKRIIFSFIGFTCIPLDPSLMQSLQDSQAFIDLLPNSPTLTEVNKTTSKLLQRESNGDQWLKEQALFFKKMVVEYVAFVQLDKYDWYGQVINYPTAPVSDKSNQWSELWQSSTGRC